MEAVTVHWYVAGAEYLRVYCSGQRQTVEASDGAAVQVTGIVNYKQYRSVVPSSTRSAREKP